jgi:hypothetical protein
LIKYVSEWLGEMSKVFIIKEFDGRLTPGSQVLIGYV